MDIAVLFCTLKKYLIYQEMYDYEEIMADCFYGFNDGYCLPGRGKERRSPC